MGLGGPVGEEGMRESERGTAGYFAGNKIQHVSMVKIPG